MGGRGVAPDVLRRARAGDPIQERRRTGLGGTRTGSVREPSSRADPLAGAGQGFVTREGAHRQQAHSGRRVIEPQAVGLLLVGVSGARTEAEGHGRRERLGGSRLEE